MIIDLPSTTTEAVNKKLVEIRETGGAVTLGRVLTLVIPTDDGAQTEAAIDAANDASRIHPCRVIVVARGSKQARTRLDAQVRVGGDAGASEVVVLRLYGPLADHGDSVVVPFLLPDTPIVAWWPGEPPAVPSQDPIGRLATRRITDASMAKHPVRSLTQRVGSYAEGDTDLSWTRITSWRALLASALDQPPYEPVTSATVTGGSESPSTEIIAGWLAAQLRLPVKRVRDGEGGIRSVELKRAGGSVTLERPPGGVAQLTQPGQPDRRVVLTRRSLRDCLAEELRRLDADEVYAGALAGLSEVRRSRPGGTRGRSGKDSE
jgi:glucose-6-phosphate dehydrogenase assembly protein OpcA